MAQILKKNGPNVCKNGPVRLYLSLYRALKFKDTGSIITDGWITSEIGTSSLGQSVEVLISANFWLVCKEIA